MHSGVSIFYTQDRNIARSITYVPMPGSTIKQCLDGLSLFPQPVPGQLIVLEEVMGLIPHFCVVVVHPLSLRLCQERRFDQVTTQGRHGEVLETQRRLVAKFMGRLDLATHDDV